MENNTSFNINKDYFNKLIVNFNILETEFDNTIKKIKSKNRIFNLNENPVIYARNAIYKLKDFFDSHNINLFNDDNYLKFAYISFLEAALEEMAMCLGNMLTYSESPLFERLSHRKLLHISFKTYTYDFIALKHFDAKYIGRYIKIMLVSDRDFENFKPGMLFKYIVLVQKELANIGIDFTKDPEYIDIMNLIKYKEDKIKNEELDIESFDKEVADMSIKYNCDLVRLDKEYQYRVIEDEEELKKSI